MIVDASANEVAVDATRIGAGTERLGGVLSRNRRQRRHRCHADIAEIVVKIFSLGRPVRHEHPFDATAAGPADLRVRIVGVANGDPILSASRGGLNGGVGEIEGVDTEVKADGFGDAETAAGGEVELFETKAAEDVATEGALDRKSTRLNSSH